MGLRVFTDQTMGQMRWIELQIPGAETMLVLHHKPAHVPSNSEPALALLADDVQAEERPWPIDVHRCERPQGAACAKRQQRPSEERTWA